MQVWKRRVVALVAAGVGGTGLLMSSAGAQTPPPTTIPTFTIPEIPGFPDFTIPDFTVPPPTMPPSTTVTTGPPPTMPPSSTTTISPPPTMPPPTITIPSPDVTIPADAEALVEDAISRLEEFGEGFSELIEELRGLLDLF